MALAQHKVQRGRYSIDAIDGQCPVEVNKIIQNNVLMIIINYYSYTVQRFCSIRQ